MRRADRLFQLVQLLRRRRVVTAETLAQELGVSVRTIYRDVADLVASGVPIRGEAGVGYALERGFELPPMTFTSEELAALVLGARMVQTWGDADLAAGARAALTKIEAVLPRTLRSALESTPLFAPDIFGGPARRDRLGQVRRAIAAQQKLQLTYTRADGRTTHRVVRPLGLYYWGKTWSLAAWCELRQAYRNFRPDRIDALQVRPEPFDPDEGISLDAYVAAMGDETAAEGRPLPAKFGPPD